MCGLTAMERWKEDVALMDEAISALFANDMDRSEEILKQGDILDINIYSHRMNISIRRILKRIYVRNALT